MWNERKWDSVVLVRNKQMTCDCSNKSTIPNAPSHIYLYGELIHIQIGALMGVHRDG